MVLTSRDVSAVSPSCAPESPVSLFVFCFLPVLCKPLTDIDKECELTGRLNTLTDMLLFLFPVSE